MRVTEGRASGKLGIGHCPAELARELARPAERMTSGFWPNSRLCPSPCCA